METRSEAGWRHGRRQGGDTAGGRWRHGRRQVETQEGRRETRPSHPQEGGQWRHVALRDRWRMETRRRGPTLKNAIWNGRRPCSSGAERTSAPAADDPAASMSRSSTSRLPVEQHTYQKGGEAQ